jgi:hypothetical protein
MNILRLPVTVVQKSEETTNDFDERKHYSLAKLPGKYKMKDCHSSVCKGS